MSELLTVKQTARYLGVSESTVRRLRDRGTLRFVNLTGAPNGRGRCPKPWLDQWLEAGCPE